MKGSSAFILQRAVAGNYYMNYVENDDSSACTKTLFSS